MRKYIPATLREAEVLDVPLSEAAPIAVVKEPMPMDTIGSEPGRSPARPIAFCPTQDDAERVSKALNGPQTTQKRPEMVDVAKLAADPDYRRRLQAELVKNEDLLRTFEALVVRARRQREQTR